MAAGAGLVLLAVVGAVACDHCCARFQAAGAQAQGIGCMCRTPGNHHFGDSHWSVHRCAVVSGHLWDPWTLAPGAESDTAEHIMALCASFGAPVELSCAHSVSLSLAASAHLRRI